MKRILSVLCIGTIPFFLQAQQPYVNPSLFTATSVKDTVQFHVPLPVDSGTFRHLWLFGDGRISTDDTPTHIYADCGTYEVKHFLLKLNNDGVITRSDSSFAMVKTECPMICKIEPYFTWKQYQMDPFGQITLGKSSVLFTISSLSDMPKEAKFTWLVDGQLASARINPWLHFPRGGYYTVCFRITLMNGCVVERCERIGVAEY